ncbi:MAG: bifunctional 2-C-methyl-D-erythritol 4-phosphate cytidylyltransferase/2-C-methyl-D-erythritol 2,4-cyclodiphosphate synthase [Brevundimonas sp.]|uniref:bifunctional 2-C-methyl-D-erythritol 4-phosphate cytidylyltransferase/2-C-methyl-D-erythritol 2,4-cyclodiphosphate synthase n=1 Tax=Brevundimonas sp. TaxID=1871086 RepID=UPI00271CB062|nr:bifunctional 2-C-methyl-D-erythritol 4-phosphate cytidylyltransferase/2-C-methyl-D-erythritol 2,4-cyclodiphosphate synthase [Brevundimonas sp.]MDO9589479.1 bifunctional 2-C-methyl-D-erythritol 4-phosphate cytidylyltransferase/2-C-methyl-D-erythritol 2,4-cyclodiphosphate synthase [Brevundimonas sp.]MDP3656524.1 bifunctional 2-C-methyl-D-erythritol 4-phosphate cytidylyltransferase/2-C-methyl-D-erythritol 2,4-cyclodiphosphate synthase [Brevundimonas sp.]MDZ4113317.1 bifunctional 2-C-methyl-D-ery
MTTALPAFAAIVVAAGSGSRAGEAKQWRALGGKPVARWSVEVLLAAGAEEVVVVIADGAAAEARTALAGLSGWRLATGGATRAASVRNGLKALGGPGDRPVLIHDAARPLLDAPVIRRLIAALQDADGALPALPVADSLRRASDGLVAGAVDREGLWRAQTPQAFRYQAIVDACAAWPDAEPATDEAAVLERAGGRVRIVEGDPRLMKLTFPEDFAMAEALIPRQIRVGQGFDAHRWGPGTSVWLCGVEIPHDQTLIGHSDADAGLHALTDAILGAMGDGDIGDHFPPTDPQWRGVSSDRFLIHAVERLHARGGRLINVDVTLICERPRVKPHRQAMRERLAELLSLPLDAVSVKATTTEAMGFTGRGEGLAAQALATLELIA